MSFHPGREAKLYYNTGSYDTPTWTEIVRVGDVSLPMSRNTSTVTTRESDNQKTIIGSLIYQITGTLYEKVTEDSVFDAIKASFQAASHIEIAAMNQDISTVGATGIRGFFCVTSFERAESISDAVSRSFTMDEVDHEEDGTLINVEEYTIEA